MDAVELFVGAGGLGLGVSNAKFDPQTVIELDKYACDTLRENKRRRLPKISKWPLWQGDVRDFDYSTVKGDIQLVSGGPSCQPFSIGGRHRAYADERDMFPEAIRAVRELKPKAFIFENVKGLTRVTFAAYFKYIELQMSYPEIVARDGEDWADHLGRLERHHTTGRDTGLTYRVVSRVLNAANFGVPQRRERVFFVGFRADLGIEWTFPKETHSQNSLLWNQLHGDYWDRHEIPERHRWADARLKLRASRLEAKPESKAWQTIRDALAGLPDPETEPEASCAFLNHNYQPGARSYVGHTGSPVDEPAKTLKAGVHGVPGGENMLRRPDGSVRYFSVRESARLQTFPDRFAFHGSWSESMRQLGNAVPVKLAQVIAEDIYVHLSAL